MSKDPGQILNNIKAILDDYFDTNLAEDGVVMNQLRHLLKADEERQPLSDCKLTKTKCWNRGYCEGHRLPPVQSVDTSGCMWSLRGHDWVEHEYYLVCHWCGKVKRL